MTWQPSAAVDGVDEVMPAYMTDMFVDAGEKKNIVTRIHSLPTGQIEEKEPENYLNRLDVVEGRLPVQRNECVLVEGNVIDGTGPLSVGNTLTIAATNGDVSGTLARYRVQDRGHRAHQLLFLGGAGKRHHRRAAPSP